MYIQIIHDTRELFLRISSLYQGRIFPVYLFFYFISLFCVAILIFMCARACKYTHTQSVLVGLCSSNTVNFDVWNRPFSTKHLIPYTCIYAFHTRMHSFMHIFICTRTNMYVFPSRAYTHTERCARNRSLLLFFHIEFFCFFSNRV